MVARNETDQSKTPGFRIEASLFGGFGVEIEGRPVKPVGSKIARSMFAQLLYLHDRQHMRSRLAGTFWPETNETTARKRLSRTLWQIRTSCEPFQVIDAQHDWIAISNDAKVSVDVLEYEALLSTSGDQAGRDELQNLARAVDLYRGDFMAGHYEPWVTEEQDRLRLIQQASLRRLVTQYQSRGSLEPALIAARRLVHIDPWDEASHRQVMRLCVLLRRPEEALRQFRECRSILSTEMDMEPSPATIDLAEEVHAQLASASVSRPKRQPVLAPVFVAREAERDLMIDALDRSLGGNGSVILLEGPGGIGKSSLVSQISDDARWRNIEVLNYSYDDTTSTGAFQAIREAVGPAITPLRAEQLAESVDDVWLAEAARIVPTVGRARRELTAARMTGDDERWRIREAIAQVLLALARLQPTLLVFEDVHWADSDTLEVVERLASGIGDSALVVCLAFRREEAMARQDTWRSLTQIDRLPSSRRVVLGELQKDDVVRLVTALGGPVDSAGALADRLLDHAGGNPLFVVETVKSLLVDNGHTNIESIPPNMPLASNVTELVRRRLDRLDANALAVVGATSVFGRPAGVDELVALTTLERREVLAGLASAVQTHVLLDEESGCVFSHNLVKRVVYDSIVWNRRAKLHRRTGDLLKGISAPAAEIAHHKREGMEWLDAMRFSQIAGDEARAVGAYLVAAEHYERAMEAAAEIDVDSSEVSRLLQSYEVVADVIGDRDLQQRLLGEMGEAAEETRERVTFHQRNALFLAKTDDYAAALAAVSAGLEAAQGNDLAVWELATTRAQIYEWSGDAVRAAETLAPLVDEIDDDRIRAEALFTLGGALAGTMEYKEAQDVLGKSLEHFVATGEKWAEVRVRVLLATVLSQIGLEQEADRSLLAAVDTARSIGYRRGEALASGNLGVRYKVTSHPGSALKYFAKGIEAFRSVGHERGVAFCRANRASLLLDVLGDVDGAVADAEAAREYFTAVGHLRGVALANSTLASAKFLAGSVEESLDLYRSAIDIATAQGPSWFGLQLHRSIVAVLIESDRLDEAESYLDAVDPWLSEFPRLRPNLLSLRALLAHRRSDVSAHNLALQAFEAIDESTEHAQRVAYRCHLAMDSTALEAVTALELAHRLVTTLIESLPADLRDRARSAHGNAAILQAFAAARPSTETFALPAASAPGGRSLTDDDLVAVEWTVAEPRDDLFTDPAARRRHRLKRLLAEASAQGASPTVKSLAAALDASRATIKRDIAALRSQGESVTTRGTRPGR